MKFLVPNYSCLQNPWLGGLPPPDPLSLCPVSSTAFIEPPPRNKIPGYATGDSQPVPSFGKNENAYRASWSTQPRHHMAVKGQLIATCCVHVTSPNIVVCPNARSIGRCGRRDKRTIRKLNKRYTWGDNEGPRPVCYELNDGLRFLWPCIVSKMWREKINKMQQLDVYY